MARQPRAYSLLVAALLCAVPVAAQTVEPEVQAAQAFEAGISSFRRADYRTAASEFLRADELVPSDEALSNAIAAARRAGAHLLVARAAERAIAREVESPELAANAREALVQAERHLSRLELGCKSKDPCSIQLDGAEVAAGSRHALPGFHHVAATTERGARAERRIETRPGATYRVVLEPLSKPATPKREGMSALTTPPAAKGSSRQAADEPFSPPVFWAALGVTAVLAAGTTWSGVDVLQGRDALPASPSEEQRADDEARIRRTDVLFLVTLVAGAVTAYGGLSLVDWDARPASAARPLRWSF